MGIYVTSTAISIILPGYLKGNTTTSDTEGTAIFADKIEDAEAIINAKISRLYSLPFTSTAVPPILRTLTKKLACYFIFQDTSYRNKTENPYFKEYKTSIDMITKIAEGDLPLSYTDGSSVPRKSGVRVLSNTKNYTPVFGLDDPENWERDSDEVDDTANSRL